MILFRKHNEILKKKLAQHYSKTALDWAVCLSDIFITL